MAKFGNKDPNDEPLPPVERVAPKAEPVAIPQPIPSVTVIDVNNQNNSTVAQQTVQMQMQTAQVQAESQVGLSQISLDREIVENQLEKEDEHWMKHFWRPAMGWLYMLICLCDFIVFPIIAMFMPVFLKGLGVPLQYVPWQSLTLSNGGLIHLAFGAILGITSYTRGQEKLAGK
jgi:hypothetical protein